MADHVRGRAPSTWRGVWREPAKFRRSDLLGARVFRIDRRPRDTYFVMERSSSRKKQSRPSVTEVEPLSMIQSMRATSLEAARGGPCCEPTFPI
jgi:hypothetical protein